LKKLNQRKQLKHDSNFLICLQEYIFGNVGKSFRVLVKK
jgi:hypothetical protein